MNDVGQLLFAVFIHIVHAKSFSQQHIDLDSYDGILLAEHIVELNIQLGTWAFWFSWWFWVASFH